MIFLQTVNASIFCNTDMTVGQIDLRITNPNSFYNGRMYLNGEKLINLFKDELYAVKAFCSNTGYGSINTYCELKVRVELEEMKVFIGGRLEPGLMAYPENNGLKLVATYDGSPNEKNWFFNECSKR